MEKSGNLSTNLVIEFHVSSVFRFFVTMAFVAINKFKFFGQFFYLVKIVMSFEKQVPPSNSNPVLLSELL